MKKIILLLTLLTTPAYPNNPLFNNYTNQITMQTGKSIRSTSEHLYQLTIQYSQPNTFFRLNAKQTIELTTIQGINETTQYNQPIMAGISEEVNVLHLYNIYLTLSLGAYIKANKTTRINSKFTFGQKIALITILNHNYNLEVFLRHLSNGSLTELNSGQNFMGIAVSRNF